jgi:predicted permease
MALLLAGATRGALGSLGLKDAAFCALVAAFPNSGFIGVPLLVAMLGPDAAGPVICTLLADLFFTSSLCIAWAQSEPGGANAVGDAAHAGDARRARVAAWRALRGALSNPLPWAIACGAAFALTRWVLPASLDKLIAMLGDAATPVALFTIGAVLRRSELHAAGRTPLAQVLPVALLKLLLHPMLVWLLGLAAQALGAPLSTLQLTALVLAAALPSASNVSLLAERYRADNGRIARIIMSSTVLAFGSFSLLAFAFDVRPR